MIKKLPWLSAMLLALFSWCSVAVAAPSPRPLVVAVVPQFAPLQIHKDWTPFLERVARDSGVPLTLKVYQRIPEFEADLLAGGPDLAFMNPYHGVMAKRAAGYLPLVRDSKPLSGILLVRHDNPVRSPKELGGGKIAFPAPNAFGASLYMRALLAEQEGVKILPVYVKTHPNVMRHVVQGEVVAGGTVNTAFQREPEPVQAQLRLLFETPGVAPHPLAAHPRVSAVQRKAIMAAILSLRDDPTARPLLKVVQMPEPVAAHYVRDYQPLERLRLDKYVVIEED
jgi:phosphonate transport system substrate-binding protein